MRKQLRDRTGNNLVKRRIRQVSEPGIYETLHARIVAGELSPGERLVEEELAEQLGQSRGAIRLALVRLEHDGLVVRERNRGARVRRVTAEEAVEILEARSGLESLATGYAAERRTAADVKELRQIVAAMARLHVSGELLAISERNAALHRRILEISGHRVAQEICARLNSQIVRFQFRTVLAPGRPPKSLAEHRAIVEAIAAGDRKAAEAAMRRHLVHVTQTLLAIAEGERAA
jgi:DNA-binding GntR family transcriptional regulator